MQRDLYRPVKVFFRPDFPARLLSSTGTWLGTIEIISLEFLAALLAIVVIDLVLVGDNAMVIALAARALPPHLRTRAVVWGTVGAIAVRAAMTLILVWLLMNSRAALRRRPGVGVDRLQTPGAEGRQTR